MAQLNEDALVLIAGFISPHPLRFLELASVSRLFYTVFTSDRVWRYLNPYGVPANIADHFRHIVSDRDNYYRVCLSWRGDEVFMHLGLELYCALGVLLNLEDPQDNVYLGLPVDIELPISRQLFWCAVNIDGNSFKLTPDELQSDDELMEIAVYKEPAVLDYILKNHPFVDRSLVLLAINRYKVLYANTAGTIETCHWFPELNFQFYSDEEIAFGLVGYCGHLIYKLPPELRDDRGIVLEAAKSHMDVLQHTRFIGDREVVMTVVERDGEFLELAQNFRDDEGIVMCAVQSKGVALLFASARLRDNEDVVSHAVNQSGYSYFYASERLKHIQAIALAAVKCDISLWEYVPLVLRDDPEIWNAFLNGSNKSQ